MKEEQKKLTKREMKTLILRLTPEDHQSLKLKAVRCGKSMQQIFELVIKEILNTA